MDTEEKKEVVENQDNNKKFDKKNIVIVDLILIIIVLLLLHFCSGKESNNSTKEKSNEVNNVSNDEKENTSDDKGNNVEEPNNNTENNDDPDTPVSNNDAVVNNNDNNNNNGNNNNSNNNNNNNNDVDKCAKVVYKDGTDCSVRYKQETGTYNRIAYSSIDPTYICSSKNVSSGGASCIGKEDACINTNKVQTCGEYGNCSVTYMQQNGTKKRQCVDKYYSNVLTNYLCSSGTEYEDSASCTGKTDACANTVDNPSCGNYSSCSATCSNETGTKSRTCVHKYYSTILTDHLCSTGSSYSESISCNGGTNCASWNIYYQYDSLARCDTNCQSKCFSEHGTSVWSCSGQDSVEAYQKVGRTCWCYY